MMLTDSGGGGVECDWDAVVHESAMAVASGH